VTGPLDERAALALLARPPAPPRDPGLFSADSQAGPGIYPQGPPMRPAAGPEWDPGRARAALAEAVPGPAERERALASFADPALAERMPDPGVRAGLAALTGTAGEPLVREAAEGRTPALRYGTLEQPSRVVGPDPAGDPGLRLVNDRYRAEHPALLAGSLVHALLAGEPPRGHAQEALLHGLLAAVHLQLLARAPSLAGLGTELARRQNSLALSLLNSRPAGSPRVRLIAPDGPGTIPGGAPAMQTPDFWSIPFAPAEPRSTPAPEALRAVLGRLLGPAAPLDGPLRYDDELARLVDDRLVSACLSPMDTVRAGRALGAI
jgi:hypothetical protein